MSDEIVPGIVVGSTKRVGHMQPQYVYDPETDEECPWTTYGEWAKTRETQRFTDEDILGRLHEGTLKVI